MSKPLSIALGIVSILLSVFSLIFGLTIVSTKIRTELFGNYLTDLLKTDSTIDLRATIHKFMNAPPWAFNFDTFITRKPDE